MLHKIVLVGNVYQGLLWAARARALLAVGLQIQDHLADDLADHLSLFWLNKQCKFDTCINCVLLKSADQRRVMICRMRGNCVHMANNKRIEGSRQVLVARERYRAIGECLGYYYRC